MKKIFKKYWYLFILTIILIIIIIGNIVTSFNKDERIRTYLLENNFAEVKSGELQNLQIDRNYDTKKNATSIQTAYNYENNTFTRLIKNKIDNHENTFILQYEINQNKYTGSYNIYNKYQDNFIEGTLNLNTSEFTCNTSGKKGLNKECEELKKEMSDFIFEIKDILINSKAESYLN